MPKVLIVSERTNIFYLKYIKNFIEESTRLNWSPILLPGDTQTINTLDKTKQIDSKEFRYLSNSFDENRYLEVFKIASDEKVDHIHFVRLFDPQRMFLALKTEPNGMNFKFSFTFYGLSQNFRFPIQKKYFDELVKLHCISNFSIVSINPEITKTYIQENNFFETSKMQLLHDPIYDDKSHYKLTKHRCRKLLNLNKDKKIVLYIGGFDYSKGPDIFCGAIELLQEEKNIQFILAGNMTASSFDFDKNKYSGLSVLFDDRYLEEELIAQYLISSDLVVLPYRKYYENSTSGVLVQSCLAKVPVLVPDISPFKQTVEKEEIGLTFECESEKSLSNEILNYLSSGKLFSGFERYLLKIEDWDLRIKQFLS
jgi:glycosyltransferase involved in cell wall biosynthesis